MALPRTLAVPGAAAIALALAACSASAPAEQEEDNAAATVTIESNLGEVEVPVDPERVVALDNTSAETLLAMAVTPVAVPKQLLDATIFADWIADDEILDVGTHNEPNLEVVSEAEPDLIVGGYRFTDYADELGEIATVLDVSGNDEAEGGFVESLRAQTVALGEVFDDQETADELVAALDAAVDDAAGATNGETVFLSVVSGGQIDNGAERIGRLIEPLNVTDVFAGEAGDIHQDSGLAPETIAQANPDWMIVLDRDAATGVEAGQELIPAKQVVDAQEAFAGSTFFDEGNIIYLAPGFYKREGIQSYTEAYEQVAEAFAS